MAGDDGAHVLMSYVICSPRAKVFPPYSSLTSLTTFVVLSYHFCSLSFSHPGFGECWPWEGKIRPLHLNPKLVRQRGEGEEGAKALVIEAVRSGTGQPQATRS